MAKCFKAKKAVLFFRKGKKVLPGAIVPPAFLAEISGKKLSLFVNRGLLESCGKTPSSEKELKRDVPYSEKNPRKTGRSEVSPPVQEVIEEPTGLDVTGGDHEKILD